MNRDNAEELKKMPKDSFNILLSYYINNLGNNIAQVVKGYYQRGLDISNKISDDLRERLIKKLVEYIYNDNSSNSFTDNDFYKLCALYDVYNTKEFKSIKSISANQLARLLNNVRDKLPQEVVDMYFKILMKPQNIHYFSWIDEIPTNIQRKLVRKNPYNIQYIKNPDPAVANWVKSKEPEAEQYMLGGI